MSTLSALQPMLQKLAYWGPLEKSEEQALLALPHRVRDISPQHYIVRERETATHCCVMLSGFSIRHKIVGGGARQIVSIHMRGDIVDLQNSILGIADHSVQMLTDGQVALIPRNDVRQLALDHPRLGMAMWQDTLVDASIFRERVANVAELNAHSRLAALLC